jgi:hypothetical protein
VYCKGLHVHMAVHCGLHCSWCSLQLADASMPRIVLRQLRGWPILGCCGRHPWCSGCLPDWRRILLEPCPANPGCSGLLVLGALTLINTFFGCIGSCYKRSLLSMYLIFGTILTVAQARRPLQLTAVTSSSNMAWQCSVQTAQQPAHMQCLAPIKTDT